MKKIHAQGFTLIEAIVVMMVFAILANFALSSYSAQIRKSRRADAGVVLGALAQREELFFSRFRTYTNVIAGGDGCANAACGLNQSSVLTPNGHYTITAVANATSYTLTATAVDTQLTDTDCRTFTINNIGVQTATNSGGADNTDDCW